MWCSGWRWVFAVAAIAVTLAVLEGSAQAAFPGQDGLLAVQPVNGHGVVLARADGRAVARLCTKVSVCGHPQNPRFSPDGRSIVFSGPGIRIIGTDGSCLDCAFGDSANPAFLPGGLLVSFVSSGGVFEDGIDRLHRTTLISAGSGASNAVWSVRGELALVSGGRLWVGAPGRLRSLGSGGSPSWSPAGTRVALAHDGWVEVVRASGRGRRRLARGSAPAFSPDGRLVAFIGARQRVEIVSSSGGRAHSAGRLTGQAVDWQPVPRHAPPACVPPAGSRVVASSNQAVVTVDDGPPTDSVLPSEVAMGCLFADGRERFLEGWFGNNVDEATNVVAAAVGGPYAALVARDTDSHYGGASDSTSVFDLRTGAPGGFAGETDPCAGGLTCSGIDQVVVGADGVSAVHLGAGVPPPGIATDPVRALACATPSLCVASDGFGQIDYSTDPAVSPWTSSFLTSLSAASCPSTSLCVGVSESRIYTSTDPAAGAGSWTSAQLAGSGSLQAISCPSVNLCVATTSTGGVVVSTDPTGGAAAWTTDEVDGSNILTSISCPSESECLATDGVGNIVSTTDPTGGPSAWIAREVTSSPGGLTSISCPSTALCLVTRPKFISSPGGALVSTAPISGTWTMEDVPNNPSAIDCPSTSLCVGVGDENTIETSAQPTSGSWTSYAVGGEDLGAISCPTPSFCAATGDGGGDAIVSANPTGGPAAWTPVRADPISCSLATFGPCGTEQIIASDRTGVHVLDSSAEFEPQTGPQLTDLALSGDTLSWHHAGTLRTATLEP